MNRYPAVANGEPSVRLATPEQPVSAQPTPPRLVLVLSDIEYEAALASRVLDVAQRRGLAILLFGIAPDGSKSAGLRRGLVRLAAFVREEQASLGHAALPGASALAPEVKIVSVRDWMERLCPELQPDDLLACISEQGALPFCRSLSGTLASHLNRQLYVFSDLKRPRVNSQGPLAPAVAWIASLGSLAAFAAVEIGIVGAANGWLQTVLLLGTLCAEVAWIYFINSLCGLL